MRICQAEAENVRIHQWQEACLCVSCIIITNRLHASKITFETSCHKWHYWDSLKVTHRVHRDGFTTFRYCIVEPIKNSREGGTCACQQ